MKLEAMIEQLWRRTCRLRSSELRDAIGGRNRTSLGFTGRARPSDRRDAIRGRNGASLEMHLEA